MRHALVCALVVVAACGVPVDSEPQPIQVDVEIPQVGGPLDGAGRVDIPVYLVRGGRLSQVTRRLPSPAGVVSVLETLLEGTTGEEDDQDLRTSIPAGTQLLEMQREGPTLRIDLNRDFASVGGDEEILAVAQIVLTITRATEVERVLFELDGVPTAVPLADGALVDRGVTADDYASLVDR